MDRRTFRPQSKLESERVITVSQPSFAQGAFEDGPAIKVPQNGVYKLTNARAYPNGEIMARDGNSIFSRTLPCLDVNIAASKSGSVVTIGSGVVLDSTYEGKYFTWDDGYSDYILTVASTSTFTAFSDIAHAASTTAFIRDEVNELKWHHAARKWILHIGTKLYYAAWDMAHLSAWMEIYCNAKVTVPNVKSQLRPCQGGMILYTSAKIFYIDLSIPIPVYFAMNADLPKIRQADDAVSVFGRRLTMSFARILGADVNRQRTDLGTTVQHESGVLSRKSDAFGSLAVGSGNHDYWDSWAAAAIDETNPRTYTLYPNADPDTHWTHYALYGNEDMGEGGKAAGYVPDKLWWMNDVPLIKPFVATRGNGTTITVPQRVFNAYDKGAAILFEDGSTDTVVAATDVDQTTIDTAGSGILNGYCGCIGGGAVAMCDQTNYIVTMWTAHGSFEFTEDLIGKLLFFSDGSFDVVTGFAPAGRTRAIMVSKSATKTGVAVAWYPSARKYTDLISDGTLDVRGGFLLKQRYMVPLPNCDLGAVSPGVIWAAQSGGITYYYSETGTPAFMGIYHESMQRVDLQEDSLVFLSAFDSVVVGYCGHGVAIVDLTSAQYFSREDTVDSGVVPLGALPIAVFKTCKYTDGQGALDRGAVRKTRGGTDIVLTQRRQLCTFDGFKFGPDLIADRYSKKFSKLLAWTTMFYDDWGGVKVWGAEQETVETVEAGHE